MDAFLFFHHNKHKIARSDLISPQPRRADGSRGGVLNVRRTSDPTKQRRIRAYEVASRRGFTLIEVMIVMAIIAGILAVGAPRLFNTSAQMRSAVRRMAVMTREVRNLARLSNSTMRIAVSMNDEKGHSYWIEAAPGNVTLLTAEQERELEQMTSLRRDEEKPKNEFSMDTRILKSPERLPRGLYFENVEVSSRPEPVSSGAAFVHFFPQGLSEAAAIHLTDRNNRYWTITINPLTGRADVFERKVELKEIQQ